MLRTIAAVFGVVMLASTVLADDPKAKAKADVKKNAKETAVMLVKVDADKKMIRVRLLNGRLMDLTVDDQTKFMGPGGDVSDQGIKDQRLHVGAPLKVVMDGQALKEVHLPVASVRESKPGAVKPAAAPTVKPRDEKPKDDKKDSTSKDK